VLSLLYLGTCVLKRYEVGAQPVADVPLLQWAMADTFRRIEAAFCAVFENLQPPWLGRMLSAIVFPRRVREFREAPDGVDAAVAQSILEPGPARARLTRGVFVSQSAQDPVATLEAALEAVIVSDPIEARISAALPARPASDAAFAREALARGIITAAEASAVEQAAKLRRDAIMVDDFPRDLGRTEVYRTTQPVTFESLNVKDDATK